MPNLEKGTVVAKSKCSCCGKPVNIKLNKNGTAYYFCPWVDDAGERCNSQRRWGRTISQQMQRDYLKARAQNVEATNGQPTEIRDKQKETGPSRSDDDGDIFKSYG